MISSLKMWIIRIPNFVAEASQVVNHKFLKLNASHFLVDASKRLRNRSQRDCLIPDFCQPILRMTASEASTSV